MCVNRVRESDLKDDLRYLKLLSKQYPTIAEASREIINLQAVLNLPKSTEHFLTDIHGEYESFNHVLRNASGVIKRKIRDALGDTISPEEAKSLATLIYYPEQKLEIVRSQGEDTYDWYEKTIERLTKICKHVSSKYTRHKVRRSLPADFSYIIEELLHERPDIVDKEKYYSEIISTIIRIDRGDEFISAVSKVIQRLVIDRLHIIGDIFDRGPGADIVMDTIMEHHSVDIQWGNHDILWMGAAAGSDVCIATVLRICARYMNLDTVEDGYGINTLPLVTFALETYGKDDCLSFKPKLSKGGDCSEKYIELVTKMHKAISVIQFKLEGEVIRRNPYMEMEDRLVLEKIDYDAGTIELDGVVYQLNDSNFPTIDPEAPYALSHEERDIVRRLRMSFENSDRLQSHIKFLFAKGSMYLNCNSNLLYHGCIPVEVNDQGKISFKQVALDDTGVLYSGKDYLDKLDLLVREGYFYGESPESRQYGKDLMWYLWTGKNSPLFGKDRMTTFERYFVDDKQAHLEVKNDYFKLQDSEDMCNMIFEEFNLDPKTSHIINGHVPVKFKKGESPIKANGKLLVIDGGFSKAYQPTTGIAGYTLIYNSYGLLLASHEPFESTERAIEEEKDILSTTVVLERELERKRVGDTDIGEELRSQINDLERLLEAYRKGFIKEIK